MIQKNGKKQRYRKSGDNHLIEVRIKSAQQLFDARDPAPFRERDLDDDFAEYILASIEEDTASKYKVVIYINDKSSADLNQETISEAVKSYLEYQIELKQKQLSKLYKTSRLFLGIGLFFLFVCIALAELTNKFVSQYPITKILHEGIVIFGWVSMWKPFELILFDWYPVYDRISLLNKILRTEFQIIFENEQVA